MNKALSIVIPEGYAIIRRETPAGNRAWGYRTPTGEEAGSHNTKELAADAAELHWKRGQVRERPCMTCFKKFRSTGPGHRMCATCRATRSEMVAV